MKSAFHRQSPAARRRLVRLAVPATAATLLTGTVVGLAVAGNDEGIRQVEGAPATPRTTEREAGGGTGAASLGDRTEALSRSAKRVTIDKLPKVVDREFRTADLNLWPAPRENGEPLAVLDEGGRVAVTGVERNGFAQIVHREQVRWVNATYLAERKPVAPVVRGGASPAAGHDVRNGRQPAAHAASGGGVSSASCPAGDAPVAGTTATLKAVYRAVCARFPQVEDYGGLRGTGDHTDGRALDIMVYGDAGTGQAIAEYLRANASTLDVSYIIWSRTIWNVLRADEGWRPMEDRGSTTANHEDHVHVQVN